MKEKFADWFYWTGTKIMLTIYIVAAFAISLWLPDKVVLVLVPIMLVHFQWMRHYEKNYSYDDEKKEEE